MFRRVSPVFPVRNLKESVDHYERLGFEVRRYEGPDAYAFAVRDGIELHLVEVDGLRAQNNTSAVYLYVDDADALYREWLESGIGGRLIEPADTSYGLREGAILDGDANLIRFGSPI